MALSFERVKEIDQREQDIVFGFVHEIEKLFPIDNPYYNISKFIIYICLSFYHILDKWDINCKSQHIQIKDNVITGHNLDYQTAFLHTICKSPNKYHWRFKIELFNGKYASWNNLIGVYKLNDRPLPSLSVENDFVHMDNCGYAFVSSSGELTDASSPGDYCVNGTVLNTEFGIACKQGDTIEMTLDLTQWTIGYVINGKDYGVAFRDIEKCDYRAAVCVYGTEIAVKLLS